MVCHQEHKRIETTQKVLLIFSEKQDDLRGYKAAPCARKMTWRPSILATLSPRLCVIWNHPLSLIYYYPSDEEGSATKVCSCKEAFLPIIQCLDHQPRRAVIQGKWTSLSETWSPPPGQQLWLLNSASRRTTARWSHRALRYIDLVLAPDIMVKPLHTLSEWTQRDRITS